MQSNKKKSENVLTLHCFLKSSFILAFLSLSTLLNSCKKENNQPKGAVPSISFISLSADSMQVGTDQFINIKFGFRDDDGDLGNSVSSGRFDIYTFDKIDSNQVNYYFPRGITQSIDPNQGVSGTCDLALQAAFQNLRPNRPLGDTVKLEIYIMDKAGNKSNTISIPNIYLLP